jgi:hypothetical protein
MTDEDLNSAARWSPRHSSVGDVPASAEKTTIEAKTSDECGASVRASRWSRAWILPEVWVENGNQGLWTLQM